MVPTWPVSNSQNPENISQSSVDEETESKEIRFPLPNFGNFVSAIPANKSNAFKKLWPELLAYGHQWNEEYNNLKKDLIAIRDELYIKAAEIGEAKQANQEQVSAIKELKAELEEGNNIQTEKDTEIAHLKDMITEKDNELYIKVAGLAEAEKVNQIQVSITEELTAKLEKEDIIQKDKNKEITRLEQLLKDKETDHKLRSVSNLNQLDRKDREITRLEELIKTKDNNIEDILQEKDKTIKEREYEIMELTNTLRENNIKLQESINNKIETDNKNENIIKELQQKLSKSSKEIPATTPAVYTRPAHQAANNNRPSNLNSSFIRPSSPTASYIRPTHTTASYTRPHAPASYTRFTNTAAIYARPTHATAGDTRPSASSRPSRPLPAVPNSTEANSPPNNNPTHSFLKPRSSNELNEHSKTHTTEMLSPHTTLLIRSKITSHAYPLMQDHLIKGIKDAIQRTFPNENKPTIINATTLHSRDIRIIASSHAHKKALTDNTKWIQVFDAQYHLVNTEYSTIAFDVPTPEVSPTEEELSARLAFHNPLIRNGSVTIKILKKDSKRYKRPVIFQSKSPEVANELISKGIRLDEFRTLEAIKTRPKLNQCKNCFSYKHLTQNCNREPSCSTCGSYSTPHDCDPRNYVYQCCPNCKGDHHANSFRCPERRWRLQKINKAHMNSGALYQVFPPHTEDENSYPNIGINNNIQ